MQLTGGHVGYWGGQQSGSRLPCTFPTKAITIAAINNTNLKNIFKGVSIISKLICKKKVGYLILRGMLEQCANLIYL
jgi:hypothetical protein